MTAYACAAFPGIAVRLIGPTVQVDEEGWEEQEREGWVDVVMVGDDRVHSVEASELVELPEGASCAECGQVGCEHDGRER